MVPDADEVYAHLVANGVEASPVQDMAWGRFVFFSDPDSNTWSLQQMVPQG